MKVEFTLSGSFELPDEDIDVTELWNASYLFRNRTVFLGLGAANGTSLFTDDELEEVGITNLDYKLLRFYLPQ
ncbi:hypothetical protein OsccyDRAFT_0598 [Leptolyngbyaceae cyanobacterium JSC-12]|nr:hypothetical protein OsccyDRAFT_0598 [Leptolyngbyaceae cyanobacterium JSC-12]